MPPSAHPRKYVCPVCSRQFRRADFLQRHQLNHGDPRFRCSQMGCGMTFHRRDVLQRHRTLHCKRASALPDTSRILAAPTVTPPETVIENSNSTGNDTPSLANQLHDIQLHSESTPSSNIQPLPTDLDQSLQLPAQVSDLLTPYPSTELNFPELSPHQLEPFINSFILYNMRRLPFIHESHLAEASLTPAIYSGVLAAGAAHFAQHRELSIQLHRLSVQLGPSELKLNDSFLQDLQYKVLAIDFALSCRDLDLEVWATTELRHVWIFLEGHLDAFLSCQVDTSDWSQWRHREELKRTVFSLFVLSVAVASTRNVAPVIHATALTFDTPCADVLWDASDATEWARILIRNPTNQPSLQFVDVFHSLFSRNIEIIHHQQLDSSFGSYILICAILETLQTSSRLPLRHMSTSHPRNLDLFGILKENVKSATALWREKWWSDPSLLWFSAPNSLCFMESFIVLDFINVCLEQGHSSIGTLESVYPTTGPRAAIDLFCALSDNGFVYTSIFGSHLFGSFSFRATVTIANAMLEWLSFAFTLAGQDRLTREALEELRRIQQAAYKGICEVSLQYEFGSLDVNTDLPHIVAELWSVALKPHRLWDPRLRQEFGQHASIHRAQETSYLLPVPLFV
ncbi:hypothetical protein B0J15DRAFT_144290 [Fusarium solani]|uniref:C2H2-type domain-containing protein n=1 Tax=Fusarium solani TaxID=169388 RepID=A0A9P9GE74_FUSSL|nr:uncharacterized protein B0J15DRAFT_144290 [Fusarium solani]KAH7237918.1 hypothetical protein B0J15DRAFT_144290 [Fusarium solani]